MDIRRLRLLCLKANKFLRQKHFMKCTWCFQMDLNEAIKKRRSIRAFKKYDVPERIIEELIKAGCLAPSAGNIQPWKFVVVRKPDAKNSLSQAANQAFIREAPVVIVVCADERRAEIGYGFRGRTLYCIQDTSAAIQNILLMAYSLGLGTCWVGAYNENQARKAISAPDGIRPVALIPVGYPNESPTSRNRRPLSQVIHYERFSQ